MCAFTTVKIGLGSPEMIRGSSCGEVTQPQTINRRTGRAEVGGLFCEQIFGPEQDWDSPDSQKRFGHIELAAPVVHPWFVKAAPSPLATLLNMKKDDLERAVDWQAPVLVPRDDGIGHDAHAGAAAIGNALMKLDLVKLSQELKRLLRSKLASRLPKQTKKDLFKRLKVVEAIRQSGNHPEWMVLDVIPVIPPAFRRPDPTNPESLDLNDRYCKIIRQSSRVKNLNPETPTAEVRDENRLLQQLVDELFEHDWWKGRFQVERLTGGAARRSSLGRTLANVAQNVVVTMHDCGTTQGITKGVIYRGEEIEVSLADAICGRVVRTNIVNPTTDEVIVHENDLITVDVAHRIEQLGLEMIQVRSPVTCDAPLAPLGICALCYGVDLSTGTLVDKVAEVGTETAEKLDPKQLTGGLRRLADIFEARKPKDAAVLPGIDGTVELRGENRRGMRTVIVRSESGIERDHFVPHAKQLLVNDGDFVRAGESLADGPLDPHDILRISGEEEVQKYLTREIRNVYRSQRVEITDKHIEIIVSQMLRAVCVVSTGDTPLLLDSIVDRFELRAKNQELSKCLKITHKGDSDFAEGAVVPIETLNQTNAQIEGLGREPARGVRPKPARAASQLLGISEAAVRSSGFISAAGFSKAMNVLVDAALASKAYGVVRPVAEAILGSVLLTGSGFRTHQEPCTP